MTGRRSLVFAISADYARHTGGWIYNERLLERLRRLGWSVERLTLPAGFPSPSPAARAAATAAFRALPGGTLVLVDQLCLSVMPELAAEQRQRLRLAVIVHHPLALEGDAPEAATRRAEAERKTLAAAALVLATSQTTAEALRRDYGVPASRLVVGLPGIDRHPPRAPRRDDGMIRLLSVGAVVPRKDHGLLIEALADLADRPWRLRIVGDLKRNPLHVAGLRDLLRQRELGGRVDLAGALESESFEEAWREADLFVAASRHEGFGMAVAEAVARGLPVVTTAAGAVESWLDRRAAIVVPVGDVVRLRGALQRTMDEPELRAALRAGALAAAAALPSWDGTAGGVDAALLAVAAGA
jgi:glycosyltransferase involved in cell wall biosynthesis